MSVTALLDIRGTAPKDRFDKIMAAYNSLSPGAILELTVDHDPKCMYYTLQAQQGGESFTFEYLEDGPVTWRVHVGKTT